MNPIIRLEKENRLSVPGPGVTILSSSKIWGKPLLSAHQKIINILSKYYSRDKLIKTYNNNYAFLSNFSANEENCDIVIKLLSSAFIYGWIIGRFRGLFQKPFTMIDIEKWILRSKTKPEYLFENKTIKELDGLFYDLEELEISEKLLDILPYAAEVFETTDEIIKYYGLERKKKRKSGIYYTPSDISDYITEQTYSIFSNDFGFKESINWFDPACGTGCLLISAFYKMFDNNKSIRSITDCIELVTSNIYGVDISPIALQSTCFIFTLLCSELFPNDNLFLIEILDTIGKNFAVLDSTKIKTKRDLYEIFPDLTNGINVIISNPPYNWAPKNIIQLNLFDSSTKEKLYKANKIYLDFIRLLPKLIENGVGGMIVPLSIAYNTNSEFIKLRKEMRASEGYWKFVHFDRTPDSLFGDDVKTRNTIIFFSSKNNDTDFYFSTRLLRWNSRNRFDLFNKIEYFKINSLIDPNGVPKVDGILGDLLFEYFNTKKSILGQDVIRTSLKNEKSSSLIRNSRTAYNWLPFEIYEVNKELNERRYSYWKVNESHEIPVIFSILHSSIAYWWWRVYGDGFHLTNDFIESIPITLSDISNHSRRELADLGKILWDEMKSNSFIKKNAGVSNPSYNPLYSRKTIKKIDKILLKELGFSKDVITHLNLFYKENIIAGRTGEIDANPSLDIFEHNKETK